MTVLKEASSNILWGHVGDQVCVMNSHQLIDDEDGGNVIDYINKFNELVSRLLNACRGDYYE